MAERRRYTRRKKTAAVVTAEMSSTLAAAQAHGIPESTIRYWLDDPSFANLRAKTREEAASGFAVLMHKAQERLDQLIPAMEPRDLITLLGVVTDKSELMVGNATHRTETRNLADEFNDHERKALRKAIDEATDAVPD